MTFDTRNRVDVGVRCDVSHTRGVGAADAGVVLAVWRVPGLSGLTAGRLLDNRLRRRFHETTRRRRQFYFRHLPLVDAVLRRVLTEIDQLFVMEFAR